MEHLPTELADLIASHSTHATLKNLRSVNMLYYDATTPLIFEHLFMGYFPHHVESLRHLAKTPRVARHVKKFTIYSDLIPEWPRQEWDDKIDFRPDYRSWSAAQKAKLRSECERCAKYNGRCTTCRDEFYKLGNRYAKLLRHHFTEEQLYVAWERYEELRVSQAKWREDREGLTFQEHFALLPNLEEASLVCMTPFHGKTNQSPVWKDLRRQIFVGPDDWMYSRGGEADFLSPEGGDTVAHTAHIAQGQAAMVLLEAIGYRSQFAGTKQITKLTIQNTHRQSYMDLIGTTVGQGGTGRKQLTMPSHNVRYLNIHEAFRHLTELKFDVPHAASCEMQLAQEACSFLRTAAQLRRLDFAFSDDEQIQDVTRTDLLTLFTFFDSGGDGSPPHWPHLEHLALLTNVAYPHFIDFLRRHATTLKSLELRYMIVENIWNMLTQIPNVLKLEHVYLECVWSHSLDPDVDPRWPYTCFLERGTDFDAPYEAGVKGYLLGSYSRLPCLELEGHALKEFTNRDQSDTYVHEPHFSERDEGPSSRSEESAPSHSAHAMGPAESGLTRLPPPGSDEAMVEFITELRTRESLVDALEWQESKERTMWELADRFGVRERAEQERQYVITPRMTESMARAWMRETGR